MTEILATITTLREQVAMLKTDTLMTEEERRAVMLAILRAMADVLWEVIG
jgi:hypothetical protein